MSEGVLQVLPEFAYGYPTLSFRTLALFNRKHEIALHIKLPIAIQATSFYRLLSERDLYNGIFFSKMIGENCLLDSVDSGEGVIVSDTYGGIL